MSISDQGEFPPPRVEQAVELVGCVYPCWMWYETICLGCEYTQGSSVLFHVSNTLFEVDFIVSWIIYSAMMRPTYRMRSHV